MHIPLQLSPDIIYLSILQALSKHIEKNSEELRHHFVNFSGKQEIEVIRDEFILGEQNDWEGVFNDMSNIISKFIGDKTYTDFMPSFSSTNTLYNNMYSLSLMDCMKS
jgi:hypothetical protein